MCKKLVYLMSFVLLLGLVAAPASAGLVSWWKLDDGGGSTAVDSGSAGNDGSVNGPLWVTGKLDGGLDFDGVDDYVTMGNKTSLKPDITSVEAWVKYDGSGSAAPLADWFWGDGEIFARKSLFFARVE